MERPIEGVADDDRSLHVVQRSLALATPIGASRHEIGPDGARFDLLGMTVMVMAPGAIELVMCAIPAMLVVPQPNGPGRVTHYGSFDGQTVRSLPSASGGFDLHAPVRNLQLQSSNFG